MSIFIKVSDAQPVVLCVIITLGDYHILKSVFMVSVESRQISISLSAIRTPLLVLGHERLWLRDDGTFVQIITRDEFVAAELNAPAQGREICPEANFIYSNPEGAAPDDAQELTEESVCGFKLSIRNCL